MDDLFDLDNDPTDDELDLGEDEMDEALTEVARALAMSVADVRDIFDSVGPLAAEGIVKGLGVDHETERAIEEAARTDKRWWQRKPKLPW